jgi:hypothetical protein
MNNKEPLIVIEVRGGLVTTVYFNPTATNLPVLPRVEVIDYDELKYGDGTRKNAFNLKFDELTEQYGFPEKYTVIY